MSSRRSHFRRFLTALLVVAAVALASVAAFWLCPQAQLPSQGGLYFPKKVELNVPHFRQGDARWGKDALAGTEGSLAAEGCAVTSAAMVLASYGVDVNPGSLNHFLTEHGGFEGTGWLIWDKVPEFAPGKCVKIYEDNASFARIDWNLLRGNPVIVRIRFPGGPTHFVVIAGKAGWDYLIRDPAAKAGRGMYPLSELVPAIEALRYYRRLP